MKTILLGCLLLAVAASVSTSKKKGKHFCKLPEVPGNATVKYKKFHRRKYTKVGSKIIYLCKKGFIRYGARKLKCLKNAKWSNNPPVCKVGRCRKPYGLKFLKNGVYKTDNENLEYLTTMTIVCNESYAVSSSSPDAMTCVQNEDGKMVWEPPFVPRCYPMKCGDPGTPDDGVQGGTTFRIGSTVRFYCNSGYKLIGEAVRKCQKNGLWSGQQPICDNGKSDCVNPGKPANGRRIGDKFNFGDVVKFDCSTGFSLVGSQKRKCQKDGNWTGIPATCEDDNRMIIPSINETSDFLASNMIEELTPNKCKMDKKGKCLQTIIRGRSINLDRTNGLDVIFMLDTSSSVGEKNFPLALKFTNALIRLFGVDYGPGGTRIAAITFNTRADLVYNLGDPEVNTVEKAIDRTNEIRYLGGGTATREALELINTTLPIDKSRTSALIIITDGKHNVAGNPIDMAYDLRTNYGMKIYAIGIGKSIDKRELRLLVGQRNKGHIFQLEKFEDFDAIIEKLTYKDYSDCGEGYIKTRARTLGGEEAKKSHWPWMVAIYRLDGSNYIAHCGGSLIRDDLVLTAAHCLEKVDKDNRRIPKLQEKQYRIVAGVTKISRANQNASDDDVFQWVGENGLKVRNIYVHSDFTHGQRNKHDFKDDIAILQLEEPVTWSPRIRPICLPRPEDYLKEPLSKNDRQHGYVAGWGYTSGDSDRRLSETLKFVSLGVNSNKTCQDDEFYKDKMFCAGDGLGRKDTCKGDSGGPFAMRLPTDADETELKYKVIGLVSWAPGHCGTQGFYGYYTRVTHYINWIKKTMRKA